MTIEENFKRAVTRNVKAVDFSEAAFLNCIAEVESDYPKEMIQQSFVFRYFYQYLKEDYKTSRNKGFNTTLIVVEDKYVSKAYLEDYASRYARKFKSYNKFTRRLHFFESKFNAVDFESNFIIGENDSVDWVEGYIGYIVVKPVSNAMFGATLLRTYEDSVHIDRSSPKKKRVKRYYPCTLEQDSHLLGRVLSITSLGFQEQDSAVGVCASNALWCTFHKTSELFGTYLPSPFQITKSVSNPQSLYHDIIVDGEFGLNERQVTKSLKSVGLSWDKLSSTVQNPLLHTEIRQYLYAYGKMGIPILMGFQRSNKDGEKEFHLVTACGYRFDLDLVDRKSKLQLVSDHIETFYVHDDLIGPFSKTKFSSMSQVIDSKEIISDAEKREGRVIETIDTGCIGETFHYKNCIPFLIIAPLAPDITIHYSSVYSMATRFDDAFKEMENIGGKVKFFNNSRWDIYLSKGTDYKASILKECNDRSIRIKVKNTSYALYIWVCRLIDDKTKVTLLDIICDSTDVGDGFSCFQINIMNEELRESLKDMGVTYLQKRLDGELDKDGTMLSLNHVRLLLYAIWNRETDFYGRTGEMKI